ncbi:MAG: hypothetical protein QOE59_4171, partial [Actinomycetota bacterium]|nr:hypothetical protein [Actinomycetota bacterium]
MPGWLTDPTLYVVLVVLVVVVVLVAAGL